MTPLRTRLAGWLLLASLPASAGWGGEADTRVVAVDPPARTRLRANDPVSVRIAYRSVAPRRFRVHAYLGGAEVTSLHSNPMPAYPAGEGEAIGWIAAPLTADVDELRVVTMDADWHPLDSVTVGYQASWSESGAARAPAAWVGTLNAAQQQMARDAIREVPGAGPLDTLVVMLMGWSVPGYFILQAHTAARYRRRWRRAALLPLLIMLPVVVYTLFALVAGSNLWPLVLLFVAPVAFLYLAAVALRHRAWTRTGSST